ncbi:MAG: DUF2301 domain-containing membrane protein [Cyanobacteriota bacterium]|nr:DUF2301 domain-containing membrane protein [Cyanobacteriota bacterium]
MDASVVYQGQFGPFTLDKQDYQEVILYRAGLGLAALSFLCGAGLTLTLDPSPVLTQILTALYWSFLGGLGLSLWMIHIYLRPLHRLLQVFWLVGVMTSLALSVKVGPFSLLTFSYSHPWTLWGLGFSFAALTGIFFKEAFCFNRLETKFLTPLVPSLLLGHLAGIWAPGVEKGLLALWAALFAVFALRKALQAIPPDIGDKSVFIKK